MRKTKIICTIGPAVADEEKLTELALTGMNVARLNFSHGSHGTHLELFRRLKQIREKLNLPIAGMMDTKGPEIRTGSFAGGAAELIEGEPFTITSEPVEGDGCCCTTYANLYKEVRPGGRVLIDDGRLELEVEQIHGTDIKCRVIVGGRVSNAKGVNIPDTPLNLPFLSEKDRQDVKLAVQEGFDFIAASFVRSAYDVRLLRDLLMEYGGDKIEIISKIENRQGIDNIDEIIEASDGIMVARGDLGVEIPAHDVPVFQKRIIKKCRAAGKIVIIATEMLDSMIRNPRPTRAEVSDIANAVFDGASAVMLSGETAAGAHPIESLKTMAQIAETTENNIDYWKRFRESEYDDGQRSVPYAISRSCCNIAMDMEARAILTVTQGGKTAKLVARFRPKCPILAIAADESVQRRLSLVWGVRAELAQQVESTDELFDIAIENALRTGVAEKGDTVIITAGVPLGISGTTNIIKAQKLD